LVHGGPDLGKEVKDKGVWGEVIKSVLEECWGIRQGRARNSEAPNLQVLSVKKMASQKLGEREPYSSVSGGVMKKTPFLASGRKTRNELQEKCGKKICC